MLRKWNSLAVLSASATVTIAIQFVSLSIIVACQFADFLLRLPNKSWVGIGLLFLQKIYYSFISYQRTAASFVMTIFRFSLTTTFHKFRQYLIASEIGYIHSKGERQREIRNGMAGQISMSGWDISWLRFSTQHKYVVFFFLFATDKYQSNGAFTVRYLTVDIVVSRN